MLSLSDTAGYGSVPMIRKVVGLNPSGSRVIISLGRQRQVLQDTSCSQLSDLKVSSVLLDFWIKMSAKSLIKTFSQRVGQSVGHCGLTPGTGCPSKW